MRINALSSIQANVFGAQRNNNVNFNGHWENGYYSRYAHGAGTIQKRVYVPDKGEDASSISRAWEDETGLAPIDWVKENNPYNQAPARPDPYGNNKGAVIYEIKGYPYMPVGVLKASAEKKLDESGDFVERISAYTELAKLSAQINDKAAVREYENRMVENLKESNSPSLTAAAAHIMDNYKDGFGNNAMYAIRYGRI